jgi:hypothetical protein
MPANQTQRPKFFEEQYLDAADLTAVVDYGRVQQARHMLGAHTWGIAIGLTLKERPQAGGAVTVHVLPGYAWDGYGRPIVVLSPYQIPEERFSAIKFDPTIDTNGKGRLIPVWLCYDETATQSPRPGFEVCDVADQFARIRESFRIEIGDQPSPADRYSGVNVAARNITDAATALQAFDPPAPLVRDESIPQQNFPDPKNRARWLIPIGYVRWLPVQNEAGHFVARDDSGTDPDSDKSRRVRRYVGVVAEQIEAADGAIRLRNRTDDLSSSSFKPPSQSQSENDLVWVEGNMRVEGDNRICGGSVDFRDSGGRDFEVPMRMLRKDVGPGDRALTVLIGPKAHTSNRFAVAVQDGENLEDKFVVLSGGNVGIGTKTPTDHLQVVGDLRISGLARKPDGGGWTFASDARLKQNVEPLGKALDLLLQLRGVRFEWKEPDKMGNLSGSQFGLVAQEVEEVFPEWVSRGPDGYRELTLRGFEAMVIEALRELKAELEELKSQLPTNKPSATRQKSPSQPSKKQAPTKA